jgi:hypothetical protein
VTEKRVVRPTIRCLTEDLGGSVGPADVRSEAAGLSHHQKADPNFLLSVPLVDLEHPLLDKANHLAEPAAELEPIKKVTDGVVFKVKTSDLRGAMWRDDDGNLWLLAAGSRQDDGTGDFYSILPSSLSDLRPTAADYRYLKLERAYQELCASERAVHRAVIGVVIEAASDPGVSHSVDAYGSQLSVRIDHDETDLAIVEVSWAFDRYDDQDRFPADVLAMIPGLADMEAWQYWPAAEGAPSPHAYQAVVPVSWVRDLATAQEIHELVPEREDWSAARPETDGSENYSHYASRRAVTMAYVEGVELMAVCGARLVAHRDTNTLPICDACEAGLDLLRATGHA